MTISRVALYFFSEAFEDLVPVRNATAATTAITANSITSFSPEKPAGPCRGDLLALCNLLISVLRQILVHVGRVLPGCTVEVFLGVSEGRGNVLVRKLKRTARFVSSNLQRQRETIPEKYLLFTSIRVRSDGELGHANMQALMKVGLQLPSFTGATDWLNLERPNATNHDRLEALKRESKGRPILLHFRSEERRVGKEFISRWSTDVANKVHDR